MRARAAADVDVRRPALRAPVDGGPRRIRAMSGDVVAVLVRDHRLRSDTWLVLTGADQLVFAVAAEDVLAAAELRDLRRRREVDRDLRDLRSVQERREEVRPALADGLVLRIAVGDVDRHVLVRRGRVGAAPEAGGRDRASKLCIRDQRRAVGDLERVRHVEAARGGGGRRDCGEHCREEGHECGAEGKARAPRPPAPPWRTERDRRRGRAVSARGHAEHPARTVSETAWTSIKVV